MMPHSQNLPRIIHGFKTCNFAFVIPATISIFLTFPSQQSIALEKPNSKPSTQNRILTTKEVIENPFFVHDFSTSHIDPACIIKRVNEKSQQLLTPNTYSNSSYLQIATLLKAYCNTVTVIDYATLPSLQNAYPQQISFWKLADTNIGSNTILLSLQKKLYDRNPISGYSTNHFSQVVAFNNNENNPILRIENNVRINNNELKKLSNYAANFIVSFHFSILRQLCKNNKLLLFRTKINTSVIGCHFDKDFQPTMPNATQLKLI